MDKHTLVNMLEKGQKIKFIGFWGHYGTRGCYSQWSPHSFVEDGITYKTAEHYMMAQKAKLFNDMESFNLAINCPDPKSVKALGRGVKNFDASLWDKHKRDIVYRGNLLKFSQNEDIKKKLIGTGECVMVETSPYDKIWGIGIGPNDTRVVNPDQWKGENLLGFILMEVRNELRKQ